MKKTLKNSLIILIVLLGQSIWAEEAQSTPQTRAEVIESLFGVREQRFNDTLGFIKLRMGQFFEITYGHAGRDLKWKRLKINAQRESIEESVARLLSENLAHWTPMGVRSNFDENADVAAIGNLQDARKDDPRVDKLMRFFFDGSKEELERLHIAVLQAVDIYLHKLSDQQVSNMSMGHWGMSSVIVLPEILRSFPPDKEHLRLLVQMFDRTRGDQELVASSYDPDGRLRQFMFLGVMGEILLYEIKMTMPYIETYKREMGKYDGEEWAELQAFIRRGKEPWFLDGFRMRIEEEQIGYIPNAKQTAWKSGRDIENKEIELTSKTLDVARRMCDMPTE